MEELVRVENGAVVIPQNTLQKIQQLNQIKKELETYEKSFREQLLKVMTENSIKTIDTEFARITYKEPTTRMSINTADFKLRYPEVYQDVIEESEVKASLLIKYKEA